VLAADLVKAGGAVIPGVHGHGGRAFGAAVAFEGPDAKAFLKRGGEALGQFFGAGDDEPQAAEILRRGAAQVDLQERRGGEHHGGPVLAHGRAHAPGIQRVRIKNDAGAQHHRQAERDGEAEGMEEGQDAQQPLRFVEGDDLAALLDVGEKVELREHHALGLAGAAAGKDDGRQSVQGFTIFD